MEHQPLNPLRRKGGESGCQAMRRHEEAEGHSVAKFGPAAPAPAAARAPVNMSASAEFSFSIASVKIESCVTRFETSGSKKRK